MNEERVILVDELDNEVGTMEKMEAHRKGILHRAFSVFVFNENGELLLQKRASSKYHSGGLWTNTCCSHPRENESVLDAAHRRIVEEMGFDTDLEVKFQFIYRKNLDNNLIEHELDHVLFGKYNAKPEINLEEAEDYCYISIEELKKSIISEPEKYTEWFKICFEEVSQKHSEFINILN